MFKKCAFLLFDTSKKYFDSYNYHKITIANNRGKFLVVEKTKRLSRIVVVDFQTWKKNVSISTAEAVFWQIYYNRYTCNNLYIDRKTIFEFDSCPDVSTMNA